MERNDIVKLRPSVAVVSNDDVTEFFLSDLRKSIILKMDKKVSSMLFHLDGTKTVSQWIESEGLSDEEFGDISNLLDYLNSEHILIKIDEDYQLSFKSYPRVFSLLENYYSSRSEVNQAFCRLSASTVIVIGLGSVGTWVAKCLAMDGVQNFIFVDDDNVELSNLHRQLGFSESSIGEKKNNAFTRYLQEASDNINIECINDQLNDGFFQRHEFGRIDLIVNCADSPTVDETSRIVGEYAMPRGIAHCIGGGYNLHQSLIGQIVIPGKTACLECFRKNLDELNVIDTSNIRKLNNKNRKLGSFPPLSSLSAAITANEAFKYLAGLNDFVMTNTRAEFSIKDLNFHTMEMQRREDCEWCVKMEDIISYKGIRTTNLKNISLQIKKGRFIGIAGPSGSGKSSLAYGTIYAIAQSEWAKVTGTSINEEQNYRIDSYSNIIPAIAMKQDNYNVNPRSTIATFMRIDRAFRLFFSSANHVSPSLFSFNNPQGACPYCNGLGYQSVINQNELIDWNKSISEKPFVLWRKSYYPKLLEKYASSLGIPLYVPLTQLSKIQVDQLLHDKTEEKIPVSYKANGKTRTHRFKYIGYLEDIETLQKDTKHVSSAQKLSSISEVKICPHCKGTRFSDNVLSYKYEGKDIGELYTMEVSDLQPIVERWLRDNKQQSFHHLLLNVNAILRGMIDGNLGYLSLNRSIPSLSGGELQRLRLVNILNSHIDDMMYIIDEPSARLHVSEYDAILKDIKHLRDKGNTVLMIEHNPYFLKSTDYNIYIGPGAGDSGGWITDEIKERSIRISSNKDCSFEKMIYIYHVTENNLYDVSIELPLQHITAMYGPSGSGKSTLAKNIISQYPKTEYIDQKPLRGSVITTIATYSGTMDDIRKAFAVENDADEDYFNFSKEKGQCPTCKGRGKLIYEVDFGKTKIEVHCEDCKGKRFNNKALSFTYKGLSIYDILNLTIDNLIENNIFAESSKITKQLELLQKLGLGYLTLFRTTDTLSGGECQRLKLMKYIGKRLKDKLFIFDEPLRGLSNQNSMNILSLFKEMTVHGATILFIEHNVIGFTSCDYVIEMGPGKGKFGGRVMFQGPMSSFVESKNWEIYKEKL